MGLILHGIIFVQAIFDTLTWSQMVQEAEYEVRDIEKDGMS